MTGPDVPDGELLGVAEWSGVSAADVRSPGGEERPGALGFARANPSLVVALVLVLAIAVMTLFPGLFEPYDPSATSLFERLQAPSWAHLLGTDELGRDELSRLIAGFPWSVGVSVVAVAIASLIGTIVGMVGATWAGAPRWLVRRILDITIAFPFLVLAVVVIVVVGHSFLAVAVTLGVVTWPLFARVTLAEAIVVAQADYVVGARLMGAGPVRRMARHILPGVRDTLMVLVSFSFADLILLQAALSFIGLGAPLGTPTWGNMLSDSEQYLTNAPWLLAAPALAIVFVVVAANLLADRLSAYQARQR